jgi:hypothetical protein
MNIATLLPPAERFNASVCARLKIQPYNCNNIYPQQVRNIVASSETGSICLQRYSDFIQGNGFADKVFAQTVINNRQQTADDLLHALAPDLAAFNGFALHVNYSLAGKITQLQHIPFENCRLGEPDEKGAVACIALHEDWTGKKRVNGKCRRPSPETIDYLPVFDPDPQTVRHQIAAAKGIDRYRGQVLWVSGKGDLLYPAAIYDAALTQMSIEEGLSNIAYRNTRFGFRAAGMLISRRQTAAGADKTENEPQQSLAEQLAVLQGDTGTGAIVHLQLEENQEQPQFLPLDAQNYDSAFVTTTDNACEKIYSAFGQEAWLRVRKGSLGFSHEVLREAYEYYSTITGIQRRLLERAFEKLMLHWRQPLQTNNFEIQPLQYVDAR